jgi:SPW repeat
MEVTMAGLRVFGIHRTWEDWFGMILGIVIGASPWLTGQTDGTAVVVNTILIGVFVLALAMLQFIDLRLWEEVGAILCGLWLITSPSNFLYGGALATWHLVLGTIVMLLAAAELWQDWKLSDDELAQHGQ